MCLIWVIYIMSLWRINDARRLTFRRQNIFSPAYLHIYLLLEVRIRLLLPCYRWHLDSKTFELRRVRNCYLRVALDQHHEYMHFVAVDWSLSNFQWMISRTPEETHLLANYSHEYWQNVTFVTSWREPEFNMNVATENSKNMQPINKPDSYNQDLLWMVIARTGFQLYLAVDYFVWLGNWPLPDWYLKQWVVGLLCLKHLVRRSFWNKKQFIDFC